MIKNSRHEARHRCVVTLESLDPDLSRIVELRFFAGLTIEETAKVLQTSASTVKRDWQTAKAWLMREMTSRN